MLGPLESLILAHSVESEEVATLPPASQTLSRLSLISRNSRRLLKLVNSILRFSSIEAGKLEVKFMRQNSFGAVTRSLIECFDALSVQSGLELRMERGLAMDQVMDSETSFDIRDPSEEVDSIFIDTELWEQIIFNLISNSFKHTWKGSITCSLYDSAYDGREGIRFDVVDTGVGISERHRASVFERFYRADNTDSRTTEGSRLLSFHSLWFSATDVSGFRDNHSWNWIITRQRVSSTARW
jgi:signal transduction histidine kinase